jgi:hypothetical protein
MSVYSKFLSLISGSARTVDLSTNTLSVQGVQINAATGGGAITQAAHSSTSSYTIVWPQAQAASSGYVLTNDGSGNLSWSPAAATGANTALSNLSAVAINTSLLPGVDDSINLGSSSFSWASANIHSLADASGVISVDVYNRFLKDSSGVTQLTWATTGIEINVNPLNLNSNKIVNLATPTNPNDAANKAYVDAAINGLTWKGPVAAYSAINVPLTGSTPLVIDGYTVLNNDLLLLGNQTTASQNGEYTAAISGGSYTLTANGQPTAAGDAWLVLNGTTYSNSAFVATAAVPAAQFTEFAGPTALNFTAPLVLTGNTVSITQATTSTNGYLSSTDWNTFNNKQPAGSYITALTGDVSASGPGSAVATLATVNSNVGSFGSSTSIPSFTVNAKGLITAASGNAVVAPAGTLSGTTLNSTVVNSSLTSVGTIGTGVWQGSAVGAIYGGTGLTSYTTGDLIYASATNTLHNLAIGSTGNVLTVVGGIPSWQPAATSGTVTSVSVVSANGFAGTVANPSTTPAITIETTINSPVLAGNGTAISAATTTGTGSTVVLSASPTLTGTVLATNATLSGNLVAPIIQISGTYNGAATLSANTTYALRYGIPANSETAGDFYLADWNTASFDLFWVIGLYSSTSTTATGASITITSKGSYTLASGDTTFGSSDQGKPAWLGASGAFTPNSTFSPSSGDANEKLGIVTSASTIYVDCQMMGVS